MSKITLQTKVMIILLAALSVRLLNFLEAMTYDEIWTIFNFTDLSIGRLFFDLELPNNHPLNSVLCKFMYASPLPIEACRLPSLLAGIASVYIAGLIARKSWGNKAMVWSMIFTAVSAPLIYYSVQARGYALQTCWLLLYTYSVMQSIDGKAPRYSNILIVISAVAAVASLSTSAMFLAAVTLILWSSYDWKIPPRKTLFAIIAAAVLSAMYLLLNLKGLRSAQTWGVKIASASDAILWLWSIFFHLLPAVLLPLVLTGFYLLREYWKGFAAALLLLIALTLLTSPGPWRVYLPLAAFFALIASRGASFVQEKFSGKKWFPPAAALAAVLLIGNGYILYNELRPMDYYRVIIETEKLPSETLPVFFPADTYPLTHNSQSRIVKKYLEALHNRSSERTLLLIGMPEDMIWGTDKDFAPRSQQLPHRGKATVIGRTPARELKLVQVSELSSAKCDLIAIITAGNYEEYLQAKRILQASVMPDKLLLLNLWFYVGDVPAGAFYIAPGALNSIVFKKFPATLSSRIVFYQIVP